MESNEKLKEFTGYVGELDAYVNSPYIRLSEKCEKVPELVKKVEEFLKEFENVSRVGEIEISGIVKNAKIKLSEAYLLMKSCG